MGVTIQMLAERKMGRYSENLRNLRQKRGITVRELSGLAGIGSATISAIEHRRHGPGLVAALMIAEALGEDISDMCNKELWHGKESSFKKK